MEEVVALEEEDVLSIHITPTTPGTVFISEKCIGILALPIGMLIGETVKNMLAANTAVQSLVADAVTAVHVGNMAVAEDCRSQKLILIVLTLAVEDVVAEDAVHIMALTLEEESIES